jgi:hypothetical protein
MAGIANSCGTDEPNDSGLGDELGDRLDIGLGGG